MSARLTVELVEAPSLGGLYLRGVGGAARLAVAQRLPAAGRRLLTGREDPGVGPLPAVEHVARAVPVDADRLSAYQHLLGEPATDELPAGFVHVLAFPVATSVLVRGDFPLPLVGLVHLANRVEQHRAVRLGEELDVRAWAQGLRSHPKGVQVEVYAEVTVDGEPVWSGVSTYLARGARLGSGPAGGGSTASPEAAVGAAPAAAARAEAARAEAAPSDESEQPTGVWRLGADTGRRYAAVSGDRNPIHLSAATAKAFGFRRAIAHGMYTASRALATVGAARGPAFVWDVAFGSPVLLPGTVSFRVAPVDAGPAPDDAAGWAYSGWDPRSGRQHFHGTVRPI